MGGFLNRMLARSGAGMQSTNSVKAVAVAEISVPAWISLREVRKGGTDATLAGPATRPFPGKAGQAVFVLLVMTG